MSLTTTSSWWSSSSKPTSNNSRGSSFNPAKSSSYISAMRRGVPSSPSRFGFSPILSIICSTACSMAGLSIRFTSVATLTSLPMRSARFGGSLRRLALRFYASAFRWILMAAEELHHPRHPDHGLHVVHPQHIGTLRDRERHRCRGTFQQVIRVQPQQVSDVVFPRGRHEDWKAQAPELRQATHQFDIPRRVLAEV